MSNHKGATTGDERQGSRQSDHEKLSTSAWRDDTLMTLTRKPEGSPVISGRKTAVRRAAPAMGASGLGHRPKARGVCPESVSDDPGWKRDSAGAGPARAQNHQPTAGVAVKDTIHKLAAPRVRQPPLGRKPIGEVRGGESGILAAGNASPASSIGRASEFDSEGCAFESRAGFHLAGVAQTAERRTCNADVAGSIPVAGFLRARSSVGRAPVLQAGGRRFKSARVHSQLGSGGRVRLKAAVLKTADAKAPGGSNPPRSAFLPFHPRGGLSVSPPALNDGESSTPSGFSLRGAA